MPLWILLIPYAVFFLVFVVFSLVDVANAWRFRSGFFSAAILILTYAVGTAVILYASYLLLSPVDWNRLIDVPTTLTL